MVYNISPHYNVGFGCRRANEWFVGAYTSELNVEVPTIDGAGSFVGQPTVLNQHPLQMLGLDVRISESCRISNTIFVGKP